VPVIIGIAAVIILLGVAVFIAVWWRKTKQTNKGMEMYAVGVDLSTSSGSITDIEIQQQIGGGNFGEVYRGLWQDTTVVALKKLKGIEQLKEFETEVNALK